MHRCIPSIRSAVVALACLFQLATSPVFAQQVPTGRVFVQNKSTKCVMEVREEREEPETQVWQSRIKYTGGQKFHLQRLSDGTYRMYWNSNSSYNPVGLMVSLKYYLTNASGPTKSTSGGSPYSNYSLVLENEYLPSNIPASAGGTDLPAHQKWKIVPVPNEANTFRIQSAAFTGSEVVLEAPGQESDTPLRLSVYSGKSSQKWLIQNFEVKGTAKNVHIANIDWVEFPETDMLQGELRWDDEATNETEFKIQSYRIDLQQGYCDHKHFTVPANKESFGIYFNVSADAQPGDEYCFTVSASNKWDESSSPTDKDCAEAKIRSSPPPPAPTGVSTIRVFNCHNNQQSVRVWTYDLTVNNGQWEDRGVLASQWSGGGCPGNATPKVINLTDGHSYQLKAIDCGNAPPPQTQGSCHKLTTTNPIPGKTGGTTITLTVQ